MNIISTPTVCCMTVNKNVRFSKATLLFRSNSINSSGAMFLLENSEQIPWGCWVFFFLREPSIEYEFSEARVASLPRPQLFIVLAPPPPPPNTIYETQFLSTDCDSSFNVTSTTAQQPLPSTTTDSLIPVQESAETETSWFKSKNTKEHYVYGYLGKYSILDIRLEKLIWN